MNVPQNISEVVVGEVNYAEKCSVCSAPLSADAIFCAHCGKQMHEVPLSTSIGRQILVNAVSILLPPLGYWYTWKYFQEFKRSGNNAAKIISIVSGMLTTLSLIVSLWITKDIMDGIYQSFNQLNNLNF